MHPFVSSTVGHAYNGQRDAQEDTQSPLAILNVPCTKFIIDIRNTINQTGAYSKADVPAYIPLITLH